MQRLSRSATKGSANRSSLLPLSSCVLGPPPMGDMDTGLAGRSHKPNLIALKKLDFWVLEYPLNRADWQFAQLVRGTRSQSIMQLAST